jgi:hypothetical protein
VGVLGYVLFEGWSLMDALYMTVITVITVTTVGHTEVHELDTTGRLWTMALLITGVGTLATQPLIVDFLDIVTRGEKGIEFRLEEFGVPKKSRWPTALSVSSR